MMFNYDLGTQALNTIQMHVPPVALEVVTISVIDGATGNPVVSPVAVNLLGYVVSLSGLGYTITSTGASPLLPKGTFYSGHRFIEFVLY